jgi:phosphatidylserine decarboxylase
VVSELLVGTLLALAISLALARKWELGARRVGVAIAAIGLAVAVAGELAGLEGAVGTVAIAIVTIAIGCTILAWRFYRDPERQPPEDDDVVVSPADGEVIYVREAVGGVLPVASKHGRDYSLVELTRTPLNTDEAVVVGIAMNFLDVHVNRSPIAGRVKLRRHFPGRFGSLGQSGMVFENERATTVIEQRGFEVAVVQIASRLVRQIAGFVRADDRVELGQRIGVIRLGSQVDLVLPKANLAEVQVAVGERIRAGETVVATISHPVG